MNISKVSWVYYKETKSATFSDKKRNVYTSKGKSHVGAIPLYNTEEASLLLHFHQIYDVDDEPGDSLNEEGLRRRIFFGGSYTDALPFESEVPDLDDLVALAILLGQEPNPVKRDGLV